MCEKHAKLYQAIVDFLLESQLKLGDAAMPVRLYYPAESLARLLETEATEEQLLPSLLAFCGDAKIVSSLGTVTGERTADGRICLCIPKEGSAYVLTHHKADPFLAQFIDLLARHRPLAEIDALFQETSTQVIHQRMDGEDFDDLYYFADGIPDAYYYCLKTEADGDVIYHRFLKEDYLAMFGEEER